MLIAVSIAGECRLNGASQQRRIGRDPLVRRGGEGEGRVTSPGHPAHDNRREDGVWEKMGGAKAEREGSRGEGGSDTARARTQDTGQDEGETHREIRRKKEKEIRSAARV